MSSLRKRARFPYAAGVILGTRDDVITLVVERAAENFVRMSLQDLRRTERSEERMFENESERRHGLL